MVLDNSEASQFDEIKYKTFLAPIYIYIDTLYSPYMYEADGPYMNSLYK